MKLQTYAQIYPESIQKLSADYPTEMTALVRSINQVGMNLNQLAANNVSLTDNVSCSTQVVSTYHGKPLVLRNASTSAPKFILVGRIQAPSNCPATAQVTTPVQVIDWTVDSNNSVVIEGTNSNGTALGLIGLPNTAGVPLKDSSGNPYEYKVSLLMFY